MADKGWECLLLCPTCGAQPGFACRSPGGRKRAASHDTRPFVIQTTTVQQLSAK